MATHSSILACKMPLTEAWQATVHGITKSDMNEQLRTSTTAIVKMQFVFQTIMMHKVSITINSKGLVQTLH